MDIKNVCVIGAGAMGSGIAQLAATHGYNVYLVDITEEILKKAQQVSFFNESYCAFTS